jgi:hypothetical protein
MLGLVTSTQPTFIKIETTRISLLPEILHFVQSLKTKQPDVDFMEFAGIAAELDTNILSYFLRGNPAVIEQLRIYRQHDKCNIVLVLCQVRNEG